MNKLIDLSGQKFGEYTVLSRDNEKKSSITYWKSVCSCGTVRSLPGVWLRKGTIKSCGCKMKNRVTTECLNCGKKMEYRKSILKKCCCFACSGQYRSKCANPFNIYIRSIVSRIKHHKPDCEISLNAKDLEIQWEKQEGKCPFTGKKMVHMRREKHEKNPYQASIDRINPKIGYINGNIRFISLMANYAKHLFTDAETIEFFINVSLYQKHP